MKILKKEVKECENKDWSKTMVLDLEYSHKGYKGRILVKDYKEENFEEMKKTFTKEVKKVYAKQIA